MLPSQFGDPPRYSPYLVDVQGDDDLIQVIRIRPMPTKGGVTALADLDPTGTAPAPSPAHVQRPSQSSHLKVEMEGERDEVPAKGGKGAPEHDTVDHWGAWEAHREGRDAVKGDPWHTKNGWGASPDPWANWRDPRRSRSQGRSRWQARSWKSSEGEDAWASWWRWQAGPQGP